MALELGFSYGGLNYEVERRNDRILVQFEAIVAKKMLLMLMVKSLNTKPG